MACGDSGRCTVHHKQFCTKCYHAGVRKDKYMCKCGRSNPTNCFLCTPDLLKTALQKRVACFRAKIVKMAKTLRYLTSPSQIANKTLSLCFALTNGKLAPRPMQYVKTIILEVTDFPARAMWLAHIVDKLVIAFGDHPQYSDVFAGRCSLTDDQFIRVMSARVDDTGNPLEMDEMWCSASRQRDRNAVVESFTASMISEDQTVFKRYWHWTNMQLIDRVRNISNSDWKTNSSEIS